MSENNKNEKTESEKKEEKNNKVILSLLRLGEKYKIGDYLKRKKEMEPSVNTVQSNDNFNDDPLHGIDYENDNNDNNKNDVISGSDENLSNNEVGGSLSDFVDEVLNLDLDAHNLKDFPDPKLATYVKFALLHKAEQEYIFEKNFGFEPKNFSYEEIRDINNASLDCDRHVAFMDSDDNDFINSDFKPSFSNLISQFVSYKAASDGDEKSIGTKDYIAKVVKLEEKKHDIEKVSNKANIILDKNEQKLVKKLMKQLDKDKDISSGLKSAYVINDETKNKINNIKQGLNENKPARKKLDKLIKHVKFRQETKETVGKKIILNTHISMKDLEIKFKELDTQQKNLIDKDELKPVDLPKGGVLNVNQENIVKNIHDAQEEKMSKPSETLKQKNEILKQRSELESRMKRKLGRTCFFRRGKRKKLKEQIKKIMML